MIDNASVVSELEKMLNENLEHVLLPHVRGNSIRIKNYIIRKSKAGWLVYCIKENNQIAKLFSKTAAVAVAKSLAEGNNTLEEITHYDTRLQKHYLDAMFFKYNIAHTNNKMRKRILETRYSISKQETEQAKGKLDKFIFGQA
jgi:hypothetical protein